MARTTISPGEWGDINITRDTDGTYRARCRYRNHFGKLSHLERTGKSKAEAKRRLTTHLKTLGGAGDKTKFEVVAWEWFAQIDSNEVKPQSARTYERCLENNILPIMGDTPMSMLTPPLCEDVLMQIRDATPGQYSTAFNVLGQVCDYAVRRMILPASPTASIIRRKDVPPEIRTLTLVELAQLRSNVRTWQDTPRTSQPLLDVMDFILSTAARPGEALAVTPAKIDLEHRTVLIDGTQVWLKERGYFRQDVTKGEKVLLIPLTDFAVDMITRRLEARPNDRYLFSARDGYSMIARSNLDRAWRAARGKEFSWVTWKTFRKSVATLAAESSGILSARDLLGHTSESTTKAHYVVPHPTLVPDLTAVLEAFGSSATVSVENSQNAGFARDGVF